ncbi:MAG: 3-deoxy-manno-octulosonate cytidylyltransferase [Verrucomicrobiota bacterium]
MSEIVQSTLGAIPARWGSTRFPGKPLHSIAGKPLVQHVWERCQECERLDHVVIATDDDRIADAAAGFGAEVAMTKPDHPSGTDRIAEVARQYPDHGAIINIQGDEPLIEPGLIDELALQLQDDPSLEMVTAANPLEDLDLLDDINVVKVVLNNSNKALYFSRSCIPFRRSEVEGLVFYRHKGIYGYQRDFLLRYVEWSPSLLEQCEGLEQLRALENNARIHVVVTNDDSPGVDTPEQAAIVVRQITAG